MCASDGGDSYRDAPQSEYQYVTSALCCAHGGSSPPTHDPVSRPGMARGSLYQSAFATSTGRGGARWRSVYFSDCAYPRSLSCSRDRSILGCDLSFKYFWCEGKNHLRVCHPERAQQAKDLVDEPHAV